MSIDTPKLWCAAPDLPPGTIKIEWRSRAGIEAIIIEGNNADSVMEQWRALSSEKERTQFLTGIIEDSREVAA